MLNLNNKKKYIFQLVAIMVSRKDNGKEIKCEISNTVFPTVNIDAHAYVNITCK